MYLNYNAFKTSNTKIAAAAIMHEEELLAIFYLQ